MPWVSQLRSLALMLPHGLGFCLALGVCDVEATASGLFDSDEVLSFRLTGPLKKVARDRAADPEERPFVVQLGDRNLDVGVRARGKFRRDNCRIPPLRLNFKKKQLKGTVLDGQDKLKLVTHCGVGRGFDDNVREEYVVYRMLNRLTDVSFRVRFAEVTYDDGRGVTVKPAFLIESDSGLAARLGAEEVETERIRQSDLEPRYATLAAVFQYVIGNTDFSFIAADSNQMCCHNTLLLRREGRMLAVPYDFDMTGAVNPSYGVPNQKLRMRSLRQRRYRGFCTDDANVDAAVERVAQHREDFAELVARAPGLTSKGSKKLGTYIEQYFDDDGVGKEFRSDCR